MASITILNVPRFISKGYDGRRCFEIYGKRRSRLLQGHTEDRGSSSPSTWATSSSSINTGLSGRVPPVYKVVSSGSQMLARVDSIKSRTESLCCHASKRRKPNRAKPRNTYKCPMPPWLDLSVDEPARGKGYWGIQTGCKKSLTAQPYLQFADSAGLFYGPKVPC